MSRGERICCDLSSTTPSTLRTTASSVCKGFYICPSCSQKRTLLFAEYLDEQLLITLPHRQFVFLIRRAAAALARREPLSLWLDQRARAESEELAALSSRDELYSVTGLSDFDPTRTAAKVLWVKKNQPDIFHATARFLLVEDYITLRLTGRACSTPNLLSSSLLADVHGCLYWDRFVDHLGIASRLPEIVGWVMLWAC